jgi:hypothetical protein
MNGNKTGEKHERNNRRFSSSGGDVRVLSNFILILIREKTMEKYNGWSNYATWRVNLEVFDGFDPTEYYSEFDASEPYELGQNLKQYAEEVIFECAEVPQGLARDYADAFLGAVNWYEIAQHMINDFAEEN